MQGSNSLGFYKFTGLEARCGSLSQVLFIQLGAEMLGSLQPGTSSIT